MSTQDAERLAARLDEDEAAAKAAKGDHWYPDVDVYNGWRVLDGPDWKTATLIAWSPGPILSGPRDQGEPTAAHIARNDPASRLRDIAAKRRILALYERTAAIAASVPGDGTPARDVLDAQRELCVLEDVIAALAGVYEEAGEAAG